MKKILMILVMLITVNQAAYGMVAYPEHAVETKTAGEITERINIVYDNSGHDYIKEVFTDIMSAAVVAEDAEIWLYPIAGSIEPIKVEPSKEFMDQYAVICSKPSNEFKPENIIDKALADLKADTVHSVKRLVVYTNFDLRDIRDEYCVCNIDPYIAGNPDIIFTGLNAGIGCYTLEDIDMYSTSQGYRTLDVGNIKNYFGADEKTLFELFLIKYGYSECEFTYYQQEGYVKLSKGMADNNIIVTASTRNSSLVNEVGDAKEQVPLYIGGCLTNEAGYKDYVSKSKVKGVALSYNQIATDLGYNDYSFAAAKYNLDPTIINPATEDLYIPLINAEFDDDIKVYYRSTSGLGLCSREAEYNAKQDKEIVNIYAPSEDTGATGTSKTVANEDKKKNNETADKKGIGSIIMGIIFSVLGVILYIVLVALYVGVIGGGIAFAVSPKFRAFVHYKVSGTRIEALYDYIVSKVSKIKNEMSEAGIKIKGNARIDGDFLFISKSSKDMADENGKVALVIKELEKRGVNCWTSEKGIGIGENFNEAITEATEKCTAVLFFASINSLKSAQVESELGMAKHHQKIIIPIQIEDFDMFGMFPKWLCILNQYQKKDLFKKNPESIRAIADEVEEVYNKLRIKK